MLSFNDFCEEVPKGIKSHMSQRYQKNNYEIVIEERKDSYGISERVLFLADKRNSGTLPPVYNLEAAYETYKRSGDLEKVLQSLAILIERQYPENEVCINSEKAELLVTRLEGNTELGISAAYLFTGDSACDVMKALPEQDEKLTLIAEEEEAALSLVPVLPGAVLAVPVFQVEEFEECSDILHELQTNSAEECERTEAMLYDNETNTILVNMEDIREVLAHKKTRKRSIFSK